MAAAIAGPVERLAPASALRALIEHSFWLHSAETKALATDLDFFARVVRSIPVFRLPLEFSARGLATVEQVVGGEARP